MMKASATLAGGLLTRRTLTRREFHSRPEANSDRWAKTDEGSMVSRGDCAQTVQRRISAHRPGQSARRLKNSVKVAFAVPLRPLSKMLDSSFIKLRVNSVGSHWENWPSP